MSTARGRQTRFDDAHQCAVLGRIRRIVAAEAHHVARHAAVVAPSARGGNLCRSCLSAHLEVLASVAGLSPQSLAHHFLQDFLYVVERLFAADAFLNHFCREIAHHFPV